MNKSNQNDVKDKAAYDPAEITAENKTKRLIDVNELIKKVKTGSLEGKWTDDCVFDLMNAPEAEAIAVEDIRTRITALLYMAAESETYTEEERQSFYTESCILEQMLEDFGFKY